MTAVLTGFSKYRNRIGTIYSNGTLDPYTTDVNVYGDITIALPVTPSDDQTITITNTGPDVVTITSITTLDPDTSIFLYWSGTSWGWVLSDCTIGDVPAQEDKGTTQYAGPAGSPYTVPQTTVTIDTLLSLGCGASVIRTTTKTYSSRSAAGFYVYGANLTVFKGSYATAGYGYGLTLAAAASNGIWNNPRDPVPSPYLILSSSVQQFGVPPSPGGIGGAVAGADCVFGTVRNTSTGALYTDIDITAFVKFSSGAATLYYLDVHTVVDYSVI